jgi:hypothetical protein
MRWCWCTIIYEKKIGIGETLHFFTAIFTTVRIAAQDTFAVITDEQFQTRNSIPGDELGTKKHALQSSFFIVLFVISCHKTTP